MELINLNKKIVKFQDLELELIIDKQYEWLIDSKLLAAGYNVSLDAIQNSFKRNKDEFEENKHYIRTNRISDKMSDTTNSTKAKYLWTKRGVIIFGFLLKSDKAKQFRKFAEDLIINKTEPLTDEQQVIAGLLAAQNIIEKQKLALESANIIIHQQKETIEDLTPAAEKYRKYLDSDGLMLIRNVATAMELKYFNEKQNKFLNLGEKVLYKFLKDADEFCIDNTPRNKPNYEKRYKVKKTFIENIGEYKPTTYVTPEGADYIEGLLYKRKDLITIKQKRRTIHSILSNYLKEFNFE